MVSRREEASCAYKENRSRKRFYQVRRRRGKYDLGSKTWAERHQSSDGGGVVPAARRVVHGRARIARLYLVLSRKLGDLLRREIVTINGEPGLAMYLDGAPLATVSFATDGEWITALYTVLNPEKLRGLASAG